MIKNSKTNKKILFKINVLTIFISAKISILITSILLIHISNSLNKIDLDNISKVKINILSITFFNQIRLSNKFRFLISILPNNLKENKNISLN